MKFILVMQNTENNNIIELLYDNKNNSMIYMENNEKFKFTKIEQPETKRNKKITIQLGFSCNMKCEYCLQSKTPLKDFDKDNLDKLLNKLNNEDLENATLEFWGGEPLLYLPEIEYIVKNLVNKPGNGFLMFTNGINLNNVAMNFLIENEFIIILSHDAQGQYIRGIDPLNKPNVASNVKWLVENYKNFSINSVITSANISTQDRLDFFGKKLSVDINKINHSGEGPAYNIKTDIDNDTLHDDIYTDLMEGDGIRYGFYNTAISGFAKTVNQGRLLDNVTTKCGIDKKDNYKIFSIDGKDLSCHNYDFKFDIKSLQESSKCKNCLVANLCKSSCPAIDKNSEAFKNNCKIMYATYTAILRVALSIELEGYQLINVIKLDSY